jgi:hypothetical protein
VTRLPAVLRRDTARENFLMLCSVQHCPLMKSEGQPERDEQLAGAIIEGRDKPQPQPQP